MLDTMQRDAAQPFSSVIRAIIVRCINGADDPIDREERIQSALDMGVISRSDAYSLRTDGDIE